MGGGGADLLEILQRRGILRALLHCVYLVQKVEPKLSEYDSERKNVL